MECRDKRCLLCCTTQAAAYYAGMLAYYWVLATPSVAFLFGAYLYLSVNWFHVHYDEAFSSLQIPHHKGFSRLHIAPDGELHIFGLAMDKVPSCFTPCMQASCCMSSAFFRPPCLFLLGLLPAMMATCGNCMSQHVQLGWKYYM